MMFYTAKCKFPFAAAILISFTAIIGCVTDVKQNSEKVTLVPPAGQPKKVVASIAAVVRLPSGYSNVTVKAGSTWKDAGTIGQGSVYRPIDDSLQVIAGAGPGVPLPGAGSQSYEGNLVVSNGAVVGIYIPTEGVFIAATTPQPITFQEKNE